MCHIELFAFADDLNLYSGVVESTTNLFGENPSASLSLSGYHQALTSVICPTT